MTRSIHLVGSLGLADAETAFRTLGQRLGELASRYPDGEPGVRSNWVGWQGTVFDEHPSFEEVGSAPRGTKLFRLAPDAGNVKFEPIGYAAEAIESYSTFKALKADGIIPATTKFQVSLPTPVAVISTFVEMTDRAHIEAAYTQVMAEELTAILDAIPHDELAVQWDIAIEVIAYAGALDLHYNDVFDGTVSRVAKLLAGIPLGVDAGIHLCYGDPGHRHIIEPTDLGNCVRFANQLTNEVSRPINYVHMPVPCDRDDDAYFAPLTGLQIGATSLVLGLVHHTDGETGTRERMATAQKFVSEFDIATECGFGRRPEHSISELLDIHRAVSVD